MKQKNKFAKFLKSVEVFFDDKDDPEEPGYDPVQLGGTVLVCMTAIGALYWLLWTLLVYGGGIFTKFWALGKLAGGASLQSLGWEGYPYQMGAFEGTVGNFLALVLTLWLASSVSKIFRAPLKKTK